MSHAYSIVSSVTPSQVCMLATLILSGCLAHPAHQKGDELREQGNVREAIYAYERGLVQGVDSRAEREEMFAAIAEIEAQYRQSAIDTAIQEIEQGSLPRAYEVFLAGGWGDERAKASSLALIDARVIAHLRGEQELEEDLFRALLEYEVVHERAEPVARSILEEKLNTLERATGSARSQLDLLATIIEHPAWDVQGMSQAFSPRLISAGDRLVGALDPQRREQDFEVLVALRGYQGFGHEPWDRIAVEEIARRLATLREQVRATASTSGQLQAIERLDKVHQRFPLTPAQQRENQKLFDELTSAHAAPLLQRAQDLKRTGQPAQAHIFAALAHHYGVSLPSALDLDTQAVRIVGKPQELTRVTIKFKKDYQDNCKLDDFYHDTTSKTIGPENAGRQEEALVNIYYRCKKTVSYGRKVITRQEMEWVERRSVYNARAYCTRSNGLIDHGKEGCSSISHLSKQDQGEVAVVKESQGYEMVTKEKIVYPRNVSVSKQWRATASFRGESRSFGQASSTSLAREDGSTKARGSAVRYIKDLVQQENDKKRASDIERTKAKLEKARRSGSLEDELAALLRVAMMKADTPSHQRIDIGELATAEQERFVLTTESQATTRAALLGEARGLPAGRLFEQSKGSLAFGTVNATRGLPESREFASIQGKYTEFDTWYSTGLNPHLDYGPLGEEEGSSQVELGMSVARLPLVDAPLALGFEPKLTIRNTSLSGAIYLDPPGEADTRGFSLSLRRVFARHGYINDPKTTLFVGLGYTQLAKASNVSTSGVAGTGLRFLGPELGVSVPATLRLSVDVGAQLNALDVVDLFDDAGGSDYAPMSNAYVGGTLYGEWLFLHLRMTAWSGAGPDLVPLGGLVKLGVRL